MRSRLPGSTRSPSSWWAWLEPWLSQLMGQPVAWWQLAAGGLSPGGSWWAWLELGSAWRQVAVASPQGQAGPGQSLVCELAEWGLAWLAAELLAAPMLAAADLAQPQRGDGGRLLVALQCVGDGPHWPRFPAGPPQLPPAGPQGAASQASGRGA